MSKKDKRKDRGLAAERQQNWLRSQPHYVVAEIAPETKVAPNAEQVHQPVKPFLSVDPKYAELFKKDGLPDDQIKGGLRNILGLLPPGSKIVAGADNRTVFVSPLQQPGA